MSNFSQTCRLLIALLLSATLSFAQEAEKKNPPYYLLLEPAYMKPPFSFPVFKAQRTHIVPAILEGEKFRYLSRKDLMAIGLPRLEFDNIARENASKALAEITPAFIKDKKNVTQFAILQTTNEMAASSVFAPDFAQRFEPIFGPEMILLIPERNTVYIFPKLAGNFRMMDQTVIDEYENSTCPVSCEVFELKKGRLEAIGTFRDR